MFYFTQQYIVSCHREVGSHVTRRNRFCEGEGGDNRGMIGNEVLENHVRGWDDRRLLRPTNQRRGAGGGQQFFASLLIERKRFIVRPQIPSANLRPSATDSGGSARRGCWSTGTLFYRTNFPGMKFDRRVIRVTQILIKERKEPILMNKS